MRLSPARQIVALVCGVAVFGAIALQSAAAALDAPEVSPAASRTDTRTDLLVEPEHGRAAVRALGGDLPVAASLNHTEPEELRELLLADRTAWLDTDGRLFYKEPAAGETSAVAATAEAAAFPYEETFLLHSKPGSPRTIYLDFDGATVSGTAWNAQFPAIGTAHPAWDTDGAPATFSTAERDAVQLVYQLVAEDYAPFDVDVTTQDPGAAALDRSSDTDQVYGTRALITPSDAAANAICDGTCGGVAYVDVFDVVGSAGYQPAWVFPQKLGHDPKSIGEGVSHEVGHNLGLDHDGTGAPGSPEYVGYYTGHGAWAPIMGVGYYEPIAQWSIGEYAQASNTEDDLAVLQSNGVPLRDDDHAGVTSGASPLGTGTSADRTGVISTRTDRDVFIAQLDCTGTLTASAEPANAAPNLDVRLRLLDANGAELQRSDPESAYVNRSTASGLGAQLSRTLSAGTYFLEVDGVGAQLPDTTGYSDYASLGDFGLHVSGCLSGSAIPLATAPTGLAASAGMGEASLSWQAPGNAEAAGVSQYRVRWFTGGSTAVAGSQLADAPRSSVTVAGLSPGTTYEFDVTALGGAGTGAVSARSAPVTPTSPPLVRPGRVQIGKAQPGATGGRITATARWTPPADGSTVTGYRVTALRLNAAGAVVTRTGSPVLARTRSALVMRLPRRGTYVFVIRAFNQTLGGPLSRRSNRVTGR
jgi:hypothetical protein